MGRRANIAIDGTDVIGGQKEESGATDAITANGESAGIGISNANGVVGTVIVTIDGEMTSIPNPICHLASHRNVVTIWVSHPRPI
jgi:hypothetical protein